MGELRLKEIGSIPGVKGCLSEKAEIELHKQVLQVHKLAQRLPLGGSDHHIPPPPSLQNSILLLERRQPGSCLASSLPISMKHSWLVLDWTFNPSPTNLIGAVLDDELEPNQSEWSRVEHSTQAQPIRALLWDFSHWNWKSKPDLFWYLATEDVRLRREGQEQWGVIHGEK